jgi:hypothetical protein
VPLLAGLVVEQEVAVVKSAVGTIAVAQAKQAFVRKFLREILIFNYFNCKYSDSIGKTKRGVERAVTESLGFIFLYTKTRMFNYSVKKAVAAR